MVVKETCVFLSSMEIKLELYSHYQNENDDRSTGWMAEELPFDSRQSQENPALHNVQNASGCQRASYPTDTESYFSENKATSA
jgi:hypothetical protein